MSEKELTVESILESLSTRGIDVSAPIHATIRSGPGGKEPIVLEETLDLVASDASWSTLPYERLPLLTGEPAADSLRLGKVLGRGGSGLVQEAWQGSLGREVAVKRIRKQPPPQHLVDSLVAEARLSGSLEHPNILPVHELGRGLGGEPLLVMQKVEGTPWLDLLSSPDRAARTTWRGDPLDRNLQILLQVCRAVEFAHDRGVLHLDIKPANVMLGSFGEVWLVDWGVATRLEDLDSISRGQLVGTPAYIAPEMLVGRHCSEKRTDVFLLGAVLYQLLTGKLLYSGDGLDAVLKKALQCEPPGFGSGTPDGLAAICRQALSKDIDDRFADVMAFRMALEDFLAHRGAQRLIDAATLSLTEVARVLDAADGETAALRRGAVSITGLLSKARFGFEQGLAQWPGNQEAEGGLQETLERTIRFELDRENIAAIVPLMEALPRPAPVALRDRVDEALEVHERALDARAQLRRLARERRFAAGDWKRSILMLVNGTFWAVALLAWGAASRAGAIPDPQAFNFLLGVVGTAFTLGTIFLLRGLFLDNTMRREFTVAYMLFILGIDLNRVTTLFMDVPFEQTAMADHVVLIMFVGVLAAFVAPALWWATGVAVVSMLGTMLWPAAVFEIGALDLLLVNAITGWALRPSFAGGRFDQARGLSDQG